MAEKRQEVGAHPSDAEQDGDMVVSQSEKEVMGVIFRPSPRLDFPLRQVQIKPGAVDWLYEIPEKKVYGVVKSCWPFKQPAVGRRDRVMMDLHTGLYTTVGRLKVIRWRGRNMIVSEHYEMAGGMLVDLLDPDGVSLQEYLLKSPVKRADGGGRRAVGAVTLMLPEEGD